MSTPNRIAAFLLALLLASPVWADGIQNSGGSITISGASVPIGGTYAPARVTAQPANPTGTTSTSFVMAGMGSTASVTPATSGKVAITISGQLTNNTINDGCTIRIMVGTGAAPANGAAATGTAVGTAPGQTVAAANQSLGFSVTGLATGLTVGTPIWIDLEFAALTGGTCNLFVPNVTALEQ
jgi:hypothetical protein